METTKLASVVAKPITAAEANTAPAVVVGETREQAKALKVVGFVPRSDLGKGQSSSSATVSDAAAPKAADSDVDLDKVSDELHSVAGQGSGTSATAKLPEDHAAKKSVETADKEAKDATISQDKLAVKAEELTTVNKKLDLATTDIADDLGDVGGRELATKASVTRETKPNLAYTNPTTQAAADVALKAVAEVLDFGGKATLNDGKDKTTEGKIVTADTTKEKSKAEKSESLSAGASEILFGGLVAEEVRDVSKINDVTDEPLKKTKVIDVSAEEEKGDVLADAPEPNLDQKDEETVASAAKSADLLNAAKFRNLMEGLEQGETNPQYMPFNPVLDAYPAGSRNYTQENRTSTGLPAIGKVDEVGGLDSGRTFYPPSGARETFGVVPFGTGREEVDDFPDLQSQDFIEVQKALEAQIRAARADKKKTELERVQQEKAEKEAAALAKDIELAKNHDNVEARQRSIETFNAANKEKEQKELERVQQELTEQKEAELEKIEAQKKILADLRIDDKQVTEAPIVTDEIRTIKIASPKAKEDLKKVEKKETPPEKKQDIKPEEAKKKAEDDRAKVSLENCKRFIGEFKGTISLAPEGIADGLGMVFSLLGGQIKIDLSSKIKVGGAKTAIKDLLDPERFKNLTPEEQQEAINGVKNLKQRNKNINLGLTIVSALVGFAALLLGFLVPGVGPMIAIGLGVVMAASLFPRIALSIRHQVKSPAVQKKADNALKEADKQLQDLSKNIPTAEVVNAGTDKVKSAEATKGSETKSVEATKSEEVKKESEGDTKNSPAEAKPEANKETKQKTMQFVVRKEDGNVVSLKTKPNTDDSASGVAAKDGAASGVVKNSSTDKQSLGEKLLSPITGNVDLVDGGKKPDSKESISPTAVNVVEQNAVPSTVSDERRDSATVRHNIGQATAVDVAAGDALERLALDRRDVKIPEKASSHEVIAARRKDFDTSAKAAARVADARKYIAPKKDVGISRLAQGGNRALGATAAARARGDVGLIEKTVRFIGADRKKNRTDKSDYDGENARSKKLVWGNKISRRKYNTSHAAKDALVPSTRSAAVNRNIHSGELANGGRMRRHDDVVKNVRVSYSVGEEMADSANQVASDVGNVGGLVNVVGSKGYSMYKEAAIKPTIDAKSRSADGFRSRSKTERATAMRPDRYDVSGDGVYRSTEEIITPGVLKLQATHQDHDAIEVSVDKEIVGASSHDGHGLTMVTDVDDSSDRRALRLRGGAGLKDEIIIDETESNTDFSGEGQLKFLTKYIAAGAGSGQAYAGRNFGSDGAGLAGLKHKASDKVKHKGVQEVRRHSDVGGDSGIADSRNKKGAADEKRPSRDALSTRDRGKMLDSADRTVVSGLGRSGKTKNKFVSSGKITPHDTEGHSVPAGQPLHTTQLSPEVSDSGSPMHTDGLRLDSFDSRSAKQTAAKDKVLKWIKDMQPYYSDGKFDPAVFDIDSRNLAVPPSSTGKVAGRNLLKPCSFSVYDQPVLPSRAHSIGLKS